MGIRVDVRPREGRNVVSGSQECFEARRDARTDFHDVEWSVGGCSAGILGGMGGWAR